MADFNFNRRFHRGDAITAADFNALAAEVASLRRLRGGAGMVVRRGRSGTQIAGMGGFDKVLAYTSGGITARSSTTPGSGTASLVLYDGTSLLTQSQTVPVLNLFTLAVGTGKYLIAEVIGGHYWAVSWEC